MPHDTGCRAKDRQIGCRGCGCYLPQKIGRPGRRRIWCDGCNPHKGRGTTWPCVCVECGSAFPPRPARGKPRLYCSRKCSRLREGRARRSFFRECESCEVAFYGTKTSRFCGKECRVVAATKPNLKLTCRGCSSTFLVGRSATKRLYCTTECRVASHKISRQHECLWCSRKFLPVNRSSGKFCSRACACEARSSGHPRAREPLANRNFSRSAKQRCLLYGVPYEAVPRKSILDRDGWQCGICGKTLLRSQERDPVTGKLSDRCPSIDHIVPLSIGPPGPGHVPSNLRAACRRCNVEKGASLDELAVHSFAAT